MTIDEPWMPCCGERRADPLVEAEAQALVEVALRGVELDPLDDLGLGRQVELDLLLGAAQQERADALAQPLERRRPRRTSRSGGGRWRRTTRRRPSRPGIARSNCDHSSPRWFSIGVPVTQKRLRGAQRGGRAAAAGCRGFLSAWASSKMTVVQRISRKQLDVAHERLVRGDEQRRAGERRQVLGAVGAEVHDRAQARA